MRGAYGKIYVIRPPRAPLSFEGGDGGRGADARKCVCFLEKLRVSGSLLEGAALFRERMEEGRPAVLQAH